jgi:uncharacterized membrane protein
MKRKFLIVMFLCFIIGGYLILNFLSQMYDFWMRGSVRDNVIMNISNISERFNEFNGTPFFQRGLPDRSFSLQIYIDLVSGVMFVIAGLSIWYLVREKEIGILKEELADTFLLPEEKVIIDELKKAGGDITQRQLVNKTGLSKVKIHRVLNKLENKNIIKRLPYGMTKKVVIVTPKEKRESD